MEETPALLVMLRVQGERPAPEPEPARTTEVERRVLALLAGGATTARAARELGLSRDGVTYHLRRLSARWGAANRTELVARAYALGVLAPGVCHRGRGSPRATSRQRRRLRRTRRGTGAAPSPAGRAENHWSLFPWLNTIATSLEGLGSWRRSSR